MSLTSVKEEVLPLKRYETKLLPVNEQSLRLAEALLRGGELVGLPTETVYGLGADALNEQAVPKIYAAKGRPQDNPLIVHIYESGQLQDLAARVPDRALRLIERFWPGPLTLILPKHDRVPDCVTAGLPTVAVRCPSHEGARALLRSGVVIAAPSANLSGRPSPTTAQHVWHDLAGRIPLILDGGPCQVGLESTVVDVSRDRAVLLRPGGVTREMLQEALGEEVALGKGVMEPLAETDKPLSPGLKHTHYKPKARVLLFLGEGQALCAGLSAAFDRAAAEGQSPVLLCQEGLAKDLAPRASLSLGTDEQQMAARLFAALREADELGHDLVLLQGVSQQGVGLAVMNRALRAAGFEVRRC